MPAASTNTNSNPIARDIQNVVSDAQELLRTVQSEGSTKLTEVKGQVQAKLDNAKQMLGQLEPRADRTQARGGDAPHVPEKSRRFAVHADLPFSGGRSGSRPGRPRRR